MKSVSIGAFVACLQLFAAVLAAPTTEQPAPLPACTDQQLVITGESRIEVYVDGVRASLVNADNWRKPDTVTVPASARVIAVRAEDSRGAAGILGSGTNFVTDGSWKCAAAFSQGWETTSFDDSLWSAATLVARHGALPWGRIAGIDNGASWIWTARVITDNVVFCRKTLPPCDPCPVTGTGFACITSCAGRLDGDYQSCKGCNVFATCYHGFLTDGRQCAASAPGSPPLVWDDILKRCEYNSGTCKTCDRLSPQNVNPALVVSGTGPACITSCAGRLDGDYQSCKGCNVFATCSNGRLTDERKCAASDPPLVWDDALKRCERESTTCKLTACP